MRTVNQFGEPIHLVRFGNLTQAKAFTKMIGAQPRRFSIIGLHFHEGRWELRYRARKECPWGPDERATWPEGVA